MKNWLCFLGLTEIEGKNVEYLVGDNYQNSCKLLSTSFQFL